MRSRDLDTDKVSEREKAKLGQASALNCTQRFLCVVILKIVVSIFFMCQFCYSYELAERKYIDDGKIFDSDARLSSSHVIFMTMIISAVTLSGQRLYELYLFTQLREWATNKRNFRLSKSKGGKSGQDS
jgi:hypothetical protein